MKAANKETKKETKTALSAEVGALTKRRSAYPRDCYIRFCKERRPLLASNLRNATREALLGQQWRALPEDEKAQYSDVVEAAHPYQPVAAATDMRLHAAHLCVDSPSASQDAYASALGDPALGDRWSIYWSAKQTQSAARDSEPESSAMPSAAPSTAAPPTAHAAPLAPPPLAAALSSHTMPNRCGPSRRPRPIIHLSYPPVTPLPPIMPLVPPLRPVAPSAPSAPIAPAQRRVPTMLAAPVTPAVAAGVTPLQLQLQKLLMQTLEQMEDEAVDIL